MSDFIITAIEKDLFSELLNKNDEELTKQNAFWITADSNPGFPCRVSLKEAEVGERLLALPYLHHDVDTPYRASGPIFVRENAELAKLEINEIPEVLKSRTLSIRSYNDQQLMIDAQILQGTELVGGLKKQFSNKQVEYIHIHNAKQGCFSCCVERAK